MNAVSTLDLSETLTAAAAEPGRVKAFLAYHDAVDALADAARRVAQCRARVPADMLPGVPTVAEPVYLLAATLTPSS